MTDNYAASHFDQTSHVGMQSFNLHAASTRARRDRLSWGSTMESSLGRSISFGPFRLYPDARVVERDGARLALGSRALDILIVLTERAGQVVSHRELTQRVWRGLVVTAGSLRTHIAGLRKALGEGEGEFRYIANVPGQGYCFVAPIRRLDSDDLSASAPESRKLSALRSGPMLTSFMEREIGSGKTRLAMQVVAEISDRFADGCWLVELAPSGGPTHVVQTAANVLGVGAHGNSSLETEVIAGRRATKCLLLVLDNA